MYRVVNIFDIVVNKKNEKVVVNKKNEKILSYASSKRGLQPSETINSDNKSNLKCHWCQLHIIYESFCTLIKVNLIKTKIKYFQFV